MGRFYGAVQLILGSATVVAGALAAAFATDKNASSARILAVVAAVIAALNTFLNAGKRSADKGCGSFRVTRGWRSCDARDDVVEVAGLVDVVSFLGEVVVPVVVEVAVGFDGA